MVEEEGAVQQVHADHAEGFLLERGLGVEHPHVDEDLGWFVARAGLEFHAHPAVAFVAALEAAGDHGVGKGEEGGGVAAPIGEALDVELELAVEHRLQAGARDVAVAAAVDRVAAPTRKNQRTTSWPAPISARVPYQRGSRLILSALWWVSSSSACMGGD